jgi:hypothetical protein
MLTSIQGIYRNGHVELTEPSNDAREGARVLVTFIESAPIGLAAQGIDPAQAEILRTHLATFSEDWNSPEMTLYDDYDAAKASL